MTGQRVNGDVIWEDSIPNGAYGMNTRGWWVAKTPNGLLANLQSHEVIEHDDGTVTVLPSILVRSSDAYKSLQWHGHLIRGVWEEC